MALISRIPIAEVAAAIARGLEELLGHDVVLTTGAPELGDPADDSLPEGSTRTIVLPFSDGVVGEVTLVISEAFAMVMEAADIDASLSAAAVPALNAGAAAIAMTVHVGVNVDGAGEIATETLLTSVVGDFAAVPIFESDTRVACVVVRVVDDEPDTLPDTFPETSAPEDSGSEDSSPEDRAFEDSGLEDFTPEEIAAAVFAEDAAPVASYAVPIPADEDPILDAAVPVAVALPVPPPLAPPAAPHAAQHAAEVVLPDTESKIGVALHEFQPLADGPGGAGNARPIALLNDVNMQVTAELGRRRLRVRDIVALRPGSVIELDRAAGSPVDVLVNGAIVWHGEVVVVDEEFGIRVSEIVVDEN